MKKLLFALILSASTAVAQETVTANGYTFTANANSYDITSACSGATGHVCLQPMTLGAAPFAQLDVSKDGGGVYAVGADGYIYTFIIPAAGNFTHSLSWTQWTALGHTGAVAIAVQDLDDIYGLGVHTGCTGTTRKIEKLNAAQTGWNAISPVHCADKLGVGVDGTLVAVDVTTKVLTYKLAGGSWVTAPGTGFTDATTNTGAAYALKGSALYQIDLVGNQAALLSGIAAKSLSVTSSKVLWVVDTSGHVSNQDRFNLTFGQTGSWTQFAGTTDAISSGGGLVFTRFGTAAYHLNLAGINVSLTGTGSYPPPCPVPNQCNSATHTMTTKVAFVAGGIHGAGGTYFSQTGHVLDYLGVNGGEQSQDCDMFDLDSNNCKLSKLEANIDCSVMGSVVSIGLWYPQFMTAATKVKTNSQVPQQYGSTCNVSSWCTPETDPPLYNPTTLFEDGRNNSNNLNCPNFWLAWAVCARYRNYSTGQTTPWGCGRVAQQENSDINFSKCTGPASYYNSLP